MELDMKRSLFSTLGAVVLAGFLSSGAQASASLGACLSTELVDFDGSIVDAAVATPELSILVDAVVAAGLADALATTENITVYAPTNDAFSALPTDILDAVVADVDMLTAILTYHVTPAVVDPRRYVTPVRTDTLQGQKVFFSRYDQLPRVNQAAVSCQGVRADNGVVWVINSVLLPQF